MACSAAISGRQWPSLVLRHAQERLVELYCECVYRQLVVVHQRVELVDRLVVVRLQLVATLGVRPHFQTNTVHEQNQRYLNKLEDIELIISAFKIRNSKPRSPKYRDQNFGKCVFYIDYIIAN